MTQNYTQGGRIHGLDMSRATLLLMGVVVHSAFFSRWSGPLENPEFDWFIKLSHSFRMEGFFAVAGYLMAITLPRRPNYLKDRLRQLLVPLAFTWLFVLPIGWFASAGESLRQPYDLGTLWFLVTLSISTIIIYLFHIFGLNRIIVSYIDTIPIYLSTTLVFTICFVSTSISNKLIFDLDMGYGIYFPLACVFAYMPYLALGFYAQSSKYLSSLLNHKAVILIGAISLVSYGLFLIFARDNSDSLNLSFRLLHRAAITFISLSATMTILSLSLRIKNKSALSAKVSSAAFTIYLFHWTVLEILHAFTRGWNPWVQFVLFIPVATVICYAIHLMIVRSPVLLFMFNGRPLQPKAERREIAR